MESTRTDVNKFGKKRSFFSLRSLSIQQRLPLLICVLLLIVIVAFTWISYLTVKKSALNTGEERLKTLAGQLSSMLTQSAQTIAASVRSAVNNDAIRQFLESGGNESRSEALQTLQKLRTDSTYVAVELLDSSQNQILISSKDGMSDKIIVQKLVKEPLTNDSVGVGKIYLVKDSMYYPVSIVIKTENRIIGYIVRWRLLQNSPQSMSRLSQLLGKANLYVGNKDGSLWTDLVAPVTAPPLESANERNIFVYKREGSNKVMAAMQPVTATPWIVLVEFSQQNVLETANRFLRWVILIGGALIIIGIFAAWLMSRSITRPLNKLTTASAAIAGGDYFFPVGINRRDEVGKLAGAFNTMAEQVHKAQENLEQKIRETAEMNEKLRNLSAHLQNVQEEERKHIAREMHDELGQLLTGFKMDISWLNKTLANHNNPFVNEKLESMSAIVDDSVKFIRKLAAELRPSILDDLGLIAALEWQSQEFEKRYGIKVEFQSQLDQLDVSTVVATGLFRMYQESLTNVARHAEAKKVSANLEATKDKICFSISDDGKGFDMNTAGSAKTLGLLGMKERAVVIGGNLEINSEPGKGTTIVIEVPLDKSIVEFAS
ncbi:MAG TPA: HAMP domain-containing protein [Chitinophagaceae bacterium]|nr:HAMP domain-containing protein [Chitinophagaceae bacterium]